MDKENISVSGTVGGPPSPSVAETVEVPCLDIGGGQENEDPNHASSGQPGQAQQPASKLKVSIRSWSGCAVWKWLANDDTCGICRVAFDGCCPDCKFAGDDCPLVWGECSHCFHIHCIEKWLTTQQTQHQCPMCRQDWKYKE